jgi:glycerophosphoryl diester phosphodiesterase
MFKHLCALALIGLVACAPASSNRNPYITNRVWVIAHQGGEGVYPSNTMLGFQKSVEMGVDMLDLDINMTKDGALVVIHDTSVDRTTGSKGFVKDLTLEEIKKLDAGWYWPQRSQESDPHPFRGQGITIPTLEEVFQAFGEMPMGIEIKQAQPSLAEPFCAMMRLHNMTDKVIVSSFSEPAMADFRRACPEVMTALTASEVLNLWLFGGVGAPGNRQARAAQVPVSAGLVTVVGRNFVDLASSLGIVVQPWTINEPREMRRLIALGVHGINTDRPDLLLEVLGRR